MKDKLKENNMFSETIKELKDISIRLEIVLNALEEHCNSNDVKDFPAIPDLNEAIDLLYDVINNLEEKMERENEC